MTNFEKIKGMNTWELAEFIHKVSDGNITITECTEDCRCCEFSEEYCTEQIADWLNSEMKENE